MDKISESRDLNCVVCEDGGILVELYKDPVLGQITMRILPPGERTGGHVHKIKNEEWIVYGESSIKLGYPDGKRELIHTGDKTSRLIKMAAGTGHEVINNGKADVIIIFHSDRIYNPDKPDKEPWQWT